MELSLFPRLRYVGGAVGHRLDVYADRVLAKSVRIYLSQPGILALERINIYGRPKFSQNELTDLVRSDSAKLKLSSIRIDDGQTCEEAELIYGAHRAANGIENGYDHFETLYEDTPSWTVEFEEAFEIETVHISNFCAPSHAYYADNIVVEYLTLDNQWLGIYDRNDPSVIRFRYEKCIAGISQAVQLSVHNTRQARAKDRVTLLLNELTRDKSHARICGITCSEISTILLDCVEAFLPESLSPYAETFKFSNIPKAHNILKIENLLSPSAMPTLGNPENWSLIEASGPDQILALSHKKIQDLHINFDNELEAYKAHGFIVKTAYKPDTLQVSDLSDWTTIYDHAHNVKICQDLAWVSFLAGNYSSKCVGLIAKSVLMQRPDNATLQEAYIWCRLNLHGKSIKYRANVDSLINSAGAQDLNSQKLRFGRHAFSTPLEYRDQNKYLESIKTTIQTLETLGAYCMLIYGTLLGAVRNNTFIPHDDDVDIAYLSTATSIESVLEERDMLISQMKAAGAEVADLTGHTHLTFSVSFTGAANPHWVEIFPIWKSHKDKHTLLMYMNLMEIQEVPATIIGDRNTSTSVMINGISLPAPAQPQEFLRLRYGEHWLTPDKFYEI